ncbi:enoyl-CoA hydratase/isomerase family protein [Microbispora triticiradicis]|nr:enoyl-CoA hydratase/isomerase family protein [Microbispora triticiradicis]
MPSGGGPRWQAEGGDPHNRGVDATDGYELGLDEHVATLTINRPEKRNAMSAAMWRALPAILADLAADPKVRVLILTGAGKTFCSGADISEINELGDNGDDTGLTILAERALRAFPKPVIAMIEGYCVGGGCQLALACDLRFASAEARFGVTPARFGVVYPFSSTRRLAEIAGPATAKLLLFSAELIGADQALRTGLVDEVCPSGGLRERVYGLAATMAARSRLTLAAAKRVVDGLADEAEVLAWQREARESGELAEGLQAYREGRSPGFSWDAK